MDGGHLIAEVPANEAAIIGVDAKVSLARDEVSDWSTDEIAGPRRLRQQFDDASRPGVRLLQPPRTEQPPTPTTRWSKHAIAAVQPAGRPNRAGLPLPCAGACSRGRERANDHDILPSAQPKTLAAGQMRVP
jgi:hypothetical protein